MSDWLIPFSISVVIAWGTYIYFVFYLKNPSEILSSRPLAIKESLLFQVYQQLVDFCRIEGKTTLFDLF